MANFQFPSASMAQNSTPNLPEAVPGWGETHKPCSPPGWQSRSSVHGAGRAQQLWPGLLGHLSPGSSPSCCWLSSPGEAGAERCGCCSVHPTQSHTRAPITQFMDPSAGLGDSHLHSHLQTTATAGPSPASPGGAGEEQPLRCPTSHPRCSCCCQHSSGRA